jgi:hypothetical protein
MSVIPVDTVMVTAVGITGAGSAYKAFGLRGERRDPATHAVVLALACLAASSLLYTPSLYAFLDAHLHVTNLCELLGHAFVLAAGWNGQRLLLHLSGPTSPRRIWWRGGIAAVAVVGLAVLFTSAPRPIETTNFITLVTGQWANTGYWLVLTGCLFFQLSDIGRLAWRCARLAPRDWVGIGLAAVTIGCGVGMAAFANPLVYVLFRLHGGTAPQVLDAVAHGLCVTSMSLVAMGAAMPAWTRKLARDPYAFVRAYRAHRELRPLWSALRDAVPGIALTQRARNAEFRLYRRVIEIRDGILTVRVDVDQRTRATVMRCARRRGLDGPDVDATIEAAAIHRGVVDPNAACSSGPVDTEVIGGNNLDGEVAWLRRVARGYAHIADENCGTCTASLTT